MDHCWTYIELNHSFTEKCNYKLTPCGKLLQLSYLESNDLKPFFFPGRECLMSPSLPVHPSVHQTYGCLCPVILKICSLVYTEIQRDYRNGGAESRDKCIASKFFFILKLAKSVQKGPRMEFS